LSVFAPFADFIESIPLSSCSFLNQVVENLSDAGLFGSPMGVLVMHVRGRISFGIQSIPEYRLSP
jgi:hypothetical protein